MLTFLNPALDQLLRDIQFPAARLLGSTCPNVGQYLDLPEIITPYRLYVQGRLCIPSDVATLEGHQIGKWDATGFGAAPPCGSGGPSGNIGQFAPKWSVVTPAAFPQANNLSACMWPAPDASPYHYTQPPRYFIEGGVLNIVPAPSQGPVIINGEAVPNIDFRAVIPHVLVTDLNDTLWFPKRCESALAWQLLIECSFSDGSQISAEQRNFAVQMYAQQKKDLRNEIKMLNELQAPSGPKINTGRRQWRRGGHRVGGGW
jgi:hypothetical protein